MSVEVSEQPAHGTVAINGGSIPCDGTGHTGTVEVTIDPDAPPGAMNFELMAESPIEMSCIANGSVGVEELVDLAFAGLSDEDETDPGGFLCVNDDDDNGNGIPDLEETGPDPDVVGLTVSGDGELTGSVTLSVVSGGTRIKVYADASRDTLVTLPQSWDATELPETLYVEGVEMSNTERDVEVKLEYTGPGGPCEDTVNLTVITADLDVDTNRDGEIDDADEDGEDEWVWGTAGCGAVFLGNLDDDDWAAGHTVVEHLDGGTAGIDNVADRDDLARIVIRQTLLPPDWHLWVTLAADAEVVTVYNLNTGSAVLGLHAGGELLYQIPAGEIAAGDIELGLESKTLIHSDTLATATLILALRDEYYTLVRSDEVELRLSSWVMTSNLDPAETVYVRQLPPAHSEAAASAQFVADLQAALAGSGANVVVIDDPYYEGDVWVQDQIQIGFSSYCDGSWLPVVLNSPRDRSDFGPHHGLRDLAERELFRANMGYFTIGSGAGTQDSFGNLEVTPPVTVNDKEYKFGRIYTGLGMQLDIRAHFLWPQVVQDPFTLYTGWLLVEHVDEVVTFVPDLSAGNGGFKVLIADPQLGTDILEGEPDPGNTWIGKYSDWKVADLLTDYSFLNRGVYANALADIKAMLIQELALSENDFTNIPAFFVCPEESGDPIVNEAWSLLPDLVNLQIVNGRLLVPEPFYDGFKGEFVSRLGTIGYQEGTSLRFIDDWDVYHRRTGEIHCGTAVKRTPTSVTWWKEELD